MSTTDDCVLCGESTAPGSGRWVNRVSYSGEDEDGNELDGWSCAECLCIECDECGEPIPLDEDVVVDCMQGDVWKCGRYHYECHDTAKHGPEWAPEHNHHGGAA